MLLKKNQSVFHFRVVGAPFGGEGWRDRVRERLEEMHFRDDGPVEPIRTGFVDPWHLSTVSFDDMTRWLIGNYFVVGYRIDRRLVPRNLFNATLEQRVAAWCAERDLERCPAAVRAELSETLQDEWMRRVLPRVKHLQLTIDTGNGDAHLFGSSSDTDTDQVRRSVFRLLGAKLLPYDQVRWGGEDGKSVDLLLERAVKLGQLRDREDDEEEEE